MTDSRRLEAHILVSQLKARRAQARADFLEERADVIDGVGERFDDRNLAIWDQMAPSRTTH